MAKPNITRRDLLKSLGAGAALLPFVPAQIAQAAAAAPVRRFIVWFTPNGIFEPEFNVDGDGTDFKFRRVLAPLEKWKPKLTIVKGLDLKVFDKYKVPNNHGEPLSMNLCATGTVGGEKYLGGGPSIDQFIAQKLKRSGSFDGLSVATAAYAPHARVSYRASGDAITAETDPKKVWDSLFKNLAGAGVDLDKLRATRMSAIDVVRAELEALKGRLGSEDQRKLTAHLEHLRAQEIRIEELAAKKATGACVPPDLSTVTDEVGYTKYARRHYVNMFTAMKCDMLRVGTFVWGGPSSNEIFSWIGVSTRHHDLSHASKPQPGSADYEALTKVGAYQAEQFGRFLELLDSVPEGDGRTMLDNSLVLWTSEHRCEAGGHDRTNMPYVLAGSAGGLVKTGRVHRFKGRAHNDLMTAIVNVMGYPEVKTFGDPELCTTPLPIA